MKRAPVKLALPDDSLGDWRSRWDAIYQFLEDWRGKPFRPTTANQIADVECSLGATLPPSMREWITFYAASGEIGDCFSRRDPLVLEKLADHDAISLLLQGEGDVYWAVKTENLALSDPPVGMYCLDHDFRDLADPQRTRFEACGDCARHVSHFAFHYLLSYFKGGGGGLTASEERCPFDKSALTRDLGPPSVFGPVEVFATDEVIVWRTLPGLEVVQGVHVALRHRDVKHLPQSVQALLEPRRKSGRPWWRWPFG